jgi:hypothetical protein
MRSRLVTALPALAGLLAWAGWVHLIGWVHTRQCIGEGLDAGRASVGSELVAKCRGPSVATPFRGSSWGWPPTWEAGYLVIGTVVILALVVLLPARLRRSASVQPS